MKSLVFPGTVKQYHGDAPAGQHLGATPCMLIANSSWLSACKLLLVLKCIDGRKTWFVMRQLVVHNWMPAVSVLKWLRGHY